MCAMPASRTRAPLLPVAISQSPLLSSPLPEDLFPLVKPLPTITVGFYEPPSPCPGAGRPPLQLHTRRPSTPPSSSSSASSSVSPPSSSSSSSSTSPVTPPPPRFSSKEVIALLNLLESMDHDIATEVQRVRLGIQEARTLVRECREDCQARATARQKRRDRERRETRGTDDDFWLGV
ncbi:hypothetical protein BD414DRAFT_480424 [Trametes punicea]|nr:hypothetical protein BD414DRAFT_480424 [Trametes punicea]